MAPKKQVKAIVKLNLQATKANPAPPVGTALGPHGIAMMDFCKQYNDQTRGMEGIIPCVVTVYSDRTFTFVLKTPPASELLKKAAGIQKGSSKPSIDKVGRVTKAQVMEIVKTKGSDLSAHEEDRAVKIIEGTARSMGIRVE
jgi:large subunit ribosomal protein L11